MYCIYLSNASLVLMYDLYIILLGYVGTEFFANVTQSKEKGDKILNEISELDPIDVADNCVYAATR